MLKRLSFSIALIFLFFCLLVGCTDRKADTALVIEDIFLPVIDDENYYLYIREVLNETLPEYNTLYFSSGMGYEIRNENSNKLIITLDGGPGFFDRRMDLPGVDIFGGYTLDYFLHWKDEYSFFVPEKFDWSADRREEIFYDRKERERYTIDNLIVNYAEVIGEYLSQNEYETVILAGWSEGGFIVPELYFHLEDYNISGLVVIAAGGLSGYENYSTLFTKAQMGQHPFHSGADRNHRVNVAGYRGVLDVYRYSRDDSPEPYMGHYPTDQRGKNLANTYRWLASYLFRTPLEFYRKIDIPVLFLHGEMDLAVIVDSTKYVEENLPEKPFTYRYYPEMWHQPRFFGEFMAWRSDISAWLKAEGL